MHKNINDYLDIEFSGEDEESPSQNPFKEEPESESRGILSRLGSGALGVAQGIGQGLMDAPSAALHPINALAGAATTLPGLVGSGFKAYTGHGLTQGDLLNAIGIGEGAPGTEFGSLVGGGLGGGSLANQISKRLLASMVSNKGARAALSSGLAGAAYNTVGGGDPIEGIGGGLAGYGLGRGVEGAMNLRSLPQEHLRKSYQQHQLTPEEIAIREEQLGPNATNADISGNPTAQFYADMLMKIPGTVKNEMIERGQKANRYQADRALGELEKDIGQQKQDIHRERELENTRNKNEDLLKLGVGALEQEGQPMGHIVRGVRGAYDVVKKQSDALYKPVNKFSINLGKIFKEDGFKGTAKIAKEIEGTRKALKALSPEGQSYLHGDVTGALDWVNKFLANKGKGANSKALMQHIRLLRDNGSILDKNGFKDTAPLLNRIASVLKSDLKKGMESSGYGDIAQKLEYADKHHIENILPFYENSATRGIIGSREGVIPQGSTKELASALLNPATKHIFDLMPKSAQNAVLHSHLTGGKGVYTGADVIKKHGASKELWKTLQEKHPELHQGFLRAHEGRHAFDEQSPIMNVFGEKLAKAIRPENPKYEKDLNKLEKKLKNFKEKDYLDMLDVKSRHGDYIHATPYVAGSVIKHPVRALGSLLAAKTAGKSVLKTMFDREMLTKGPKAKKSSLLNELIAGKD